MVKKFISGLLNKKSSEDTGSKAAEESSAEVPDELPPLMEEEADKKEEADTKAAEEKKEEEKKDDVPEELPPLETASTELKADLNQQLETLEKEDIPAEVKKAKEARAKAAQQGISQGSLVSQIQQQQEASVSPDAQQSAQQPMVSQVISDQQQQLPPDTAQPSKPPVDVDESAANREVDHVVEDGLSREPSVVSDARDSDVKDVGFFSTLLKHSKQHRSSRDKLLSGDLFSRMGEYWDMRREEIKSGDHIHPQKKVEIQLQEKLEELRVLEEKWHVQKMALEDDLKYLHDREREIQGKVYELKLVSNELRLFKEVPPQHYFHLKNGVVLKCLHDLIDVLEVIDEKTFSAHVSSSHNDFAKWVMDVYEDENVSGLIKRATTREQIIEILETIPVKEEGPTTTAWVDPKKYFHLGDGRIVRTLYELYEALREMDDETYEQYVDKTKNHFADWIDDVYANTYLAEKVRRSISRVDAIEMMEAYLV